MATNLNPKGSVLMNVFQFKPPQHTIEDLVLKYEKPSKVLSLADDSLKPLIERMMKVMKHFDDREVVIDYKVRSLKLGDSGSGIYGYHLDCCNDIWDDFEPETHLIYSTVIGTKFILDEIDITGYNTIHDVLSNISFDEFNAPVNWVHKYTSKVLHSCPIVESDCQRILIRATAGFKDRIKHAKGK
ncbi:hypothetical protein AAGG91_002939 [Salmonella enterica]|uniref:hypothetical protein n=1 Tax=Salmonella enterica TaxID=28901 RepID=UPI000FDF7AB2|nr:hypothetical protein CPT_Munch_180 [Salmonella phage Munch]EHX8550421.1 hypothetical protein [Salmonella enterica]MCP0435795.1 hypothetical protein [Salmonella enterica subsp. enterica serovar Mbandaka]WNV47288.1 hypothetical protein [Klebsiella phage fENko-Kae01]ELL7856562.1 hypothetical protein [Salmonella enterica]